MMTKAKLIGVLTSLIALGITSAYIANYFIYNNEDETLKAWGNVETHYSLISFEASGRIAEIKVDEGTLVKKGEVLALLDVTQAQLQKKEIEAKLSAQIAHLSLVKEGARKEDILRAKKEVEAKKAIFLLAQKSFDRVNNLFAKNAASAAQFDEAKANLEASRKTLEAAHASFEALKAGSRPQEIEIAENQVKALKSALEQITHQIEVSSVLRSPDELVVRNRLAEVGEISYPQKPVFELANTKEKFIKVYVTPKTLSKIKLGDIAMISSDYVLPQTGKITFISNTAEFTPKTVQTEDLRSALIYEVRVEIADPENKFFLGQPVTVKFNETN